jgi:hypothetical protein
MANNVVPVETVTLELKPTEIVFFFAIGVKEIVDIKDLEKQIKVIKLLEKLEPHLPENIDESKDVQTKYNFSRQLFEVMKMFIKDDKS